MCGIYGVVRRRSGSNSVGVAELVARANTVQGHRGPDDVGHEKIDVGDWEVLLGFQRLAILDLSANGHQPMRSASGRSWIIFNGEIYNYLELNETRKFPLRSGSDTEVLLEMLDGGAEPDAVAACNGMWGFAHLHTDQQRLTLGRDRMGEKPLYIHQRADQLVFASELKTLLALLGEKAAPDPVVIARFLAESLVDTDVSSFIAGVTSLQAGSLLTIDLGATALRPQERRYWEGRPSDEPVPLSSDALRDLVVDAVRIRLRSDVPVGICLSGGVDSSIMAAAAKRLGSTSALTAITAGTPGSVYDESSQARLVAEHTGIRLEVIDVNADGVPSLDEFSDACWHNDQPLVSFAAVAYRRMMHRARDLGITVLLSGQGADELFCGYRKYPLFQVQQLLRDRHLVRAVSSAAWTAYRGVSFSSLRPGEAARYLPSRRRAAPPSLLGPTTSAAFKRTSNALGRSGMAWRQLRDLTALSVPALTHYEDRMSMAESREVRLPFLDPRVIQAGLDAPMSMKIHQGWTKFGLREAFTNDLPKEVLWSPVKRGFTLPEAEWLRGELRVPVTKLLAGDCMMYDLGLVDRSSAVAAFDAHVAGQGSTWFRTIIAPISLELWLRSFQQFL
jgi:asparagine synthase (glutamine-hydrolysing)